MGFGSVNTIPTGGRTSNRVHSGRIKIWPGRRTFAVHVRRQPTRSLRFSERNSVLSQPPKGPNRRR